jgi:maleylpyruvate isomerase
MTSAVAALTELRTSTAALLHGIEAEQWTDEEVRAPSLLPGWSRGHVLTHLARNADGISRTLSGALRGEVLARYPDGWEGRNADIEAGAPRPSGELLTDVKESAERLDRLLGAVADGDGWELPTDDDHPAGHWVLARWREVEIHRVDLAGSYTPDEWPASFVRYLLPVLVDALPKRTAGAFRIEAVATDSVTTDLGGTIWNVGTGAPVEVSGPDWALLAWLVGRSEVIKDVLGVPPDLGPWA